MAGGGLSNKSQLSVASLRESASKLPRRKAFHWVAQWFTVPQLTTKILSFVSVILTSIIHIVYSYIHLKDVHYKYRDARWLCR